MRPATRVPARAPETEPARERFVSNDAYRAEREWRRYEGTPQRELFRQLRERFLARHAPPTGWALDAGAGPGRFTENVGQVRSDHRVALDIGRAMLEEFRDRSANGTSGVPGAHLVLGDAARPPFAERTFGLVAALGNLIGFAGGGGTAMLDALVRMLTPGGTVILEIAPGPGERSRYLHRLPASSVGRLLRSPAHALVGRIEREGFDAELWRKKDRGEFGRFPAAELAKTLGARGFRVEETVAVAPALGAEPDRVAAVALDPKAWEHLLSVEETLGRAPARAIGAAAVLIAAVAPMAGVPSKVPPERRIK